MSTEALSRHVEALFAGGRSRSLGVGVELELLTADLRDGSAVQIDRIRSAHRGLSRGYVRYLGFEPGGQVEASLPRTASVRAMESQATSDLRRLRAVCARAGVRTAAVSVDALHSCAQVGLQLRCRRYVEMQRHFDRIGPCGRSMMRLTASTQLCLDWWSGDEGREQWVVANLAGPFLAAAFANAPVTDGQISGPANPRLAIWLATDPARTAFDGSLVAGSAAAAYAEFAAGAGVFAMPSDRGGPSGTGESFRSWWRRSPARTDADISHHLSTLFPPVRPRGRYLEVRFLDAQPDARIAVAAGVVACLLYDEQSRRAALRFLAPIAGEAERTWRRAAELGADDAELAEGARELLQIARGAMRRASGGYLPADLAARTDRMIASVHLRGSDRRAQVTR